jgi:hypothetical protein
LNDIFDVLKSNARIIVPVAVLVLVLAVAIGILIGLRNPSEIGVTGESSGPGLGEMVAERDETGLFVPGPVLPSLFDEDPAATLYPEPQADYIQLFDFKQVSVTELIESRRRGVDVHFKPFQVENRDLEILSEKDELAEP